MQRVKFTYSMPMVGEFENEGPDMTHEEILREIEFDYPEATDIQILNEEHDS